MLKFLLTVRCQAARNADGLSCHVPRIVAEEKSDDAWAIVDVPEAAERNRAGQRIHQFLIRKRSEQRGIGGTGAHDVEGDAASREFPGKCFGERSDAALAS